MCSTRVGKLFQDSPDVCEWGRSLALTFRKFGTLSYEKKVLPMANFFSNSVGDEGKKSFITLPLCVKVYIVCCLNDTFTFQTFNVIVSFHF
jgi:hypothetical protein